MVSSFFRGVAKIVHHALDQKDKAWYNRGVN